MIIVYIVLGVVALFLGLQFFAVAKMRARRGKPAPALGGALGKRIEQGDRLLFYFYSPGCPACRSMTPVVEKLGRGTSRVHKIDVSQDLATARQFGVLGTPATLLVDGGVIREFLVGAQSEATLSALLAA